jgi:N-methylhydantoinase A
MHWAAEPRPGGGTPATRDVHFGSEFGTRRTPVLTRAALGRAPRPGPVIVEEYDSTIVVPPDARVSRDAHDNVLIELG